MGSTVVHRHAGDPAASSLALVVALAVAEAVSTYIPPPNRVVLKWPNDLLIGDAKVSGILLEMVKESVVIGIGVNLAVAPTLADRTTAALSALGPKPDRDLFGQALAGHLATELTRWRTFGLAPVIARWQALAHPIGTRLVVGGADEVAMEGQFAGLCEDGALQLRLADGTTRTIHAGEVRLA